MGYLKEYFEKSQEIKSKIERSKIPTKLGNFYEEDEWPEPLGKGEANIVYPLGKVDNHHVAYRTATGDLKEQFELGFTLALKYFEYYCRKSAKYIKENKRAPAFCIGVIYGKEPGKKYAGLLTEDFTKGEKYKIESITGEEYGELKKEDSKEKVYFDLDDPEYMELDDLKFMSKDAVIRV